MAALNIDLSKIKQRLFIFADSKDIQQNLQLCLVVNPEIMKILLDQLNNSSKEKKIELLEELSGLFKTNIDNSLILAKRDAEIQDHNISILDDIIAFILNIDAVESEMQTLGDFILPFIRLYPVNSKTIRKVTTFLGKNFYQGNFSPMKMSLSIRILKLLFESQAVQRNQPSSYFFLYGENSGIKMIHNKTLWMFSKGFTLNMSFSICPNNRQSSLFIIRVKDSQFQVIISEDMTLNVKVFGDTEQMQIIKLQPNKWYYLRLEYLLKSRLFNKVFELQITIDGRTFQKQNLTIPQINQNDVVDEIVFGQDFHGKINTIFLSREQDFNENAPIQPPFWTNNWQQLQIKFKVNKKLFESLYLVYAPYIHTTCNNKSIVYDISCRNHGQLLENSTVFQRNFSSKDINYFGGLYNLLPLLELLKYYDPEQYPHMLEDILELFLVIFKTKFKGVQQQSINCRLFSIIGAQLPEVNQLFVTKESLKLLFNIKQQLKQVVLKEQFFRDLIWKFNVKNITNIGVIEQLAKLISIMYELNTSFYLQVFGMEQIMHYIIQQYEPIHLKKCCFGHYYHSNIKVNSIKIQEKQQTIQLEHFIENYTRGRIDPFTSLITELLNTLFNNNPQKAMESVKTILLFTVTTHSFCFIKLILDILQSVVIHPKINKKELIDLNILEYLFLSMERYLHHEIVTKIITILKHIAVWQQSQSFYQKILFSIKLYLKQYPEEFQFQKSNISELYDHEQGFKRRKTIQGNNKQQLQYLTTVIKIKKTNFTNYKNLLDIILSLILEQSNLTINDEAIEILEVYYQICTLNFKRIIIKRIFCQIYQSSLDVKESMRTEFFFTFKFLLKTLVLTKINISDFMFVQEIQKLIIESLTSLILPIMENRSKIYSYLIRLESLMAIILKELNEEDYQNNIQFVIAYVFRLLFKKMLSNKECVIGKGLENIIFYLYGVVFCSQHESNPVRMFSYFKLVEKEILLIDFEKLPSQLKNKYSQGQLVFIDAQIITVLLDKLPLQHFSIHNNYLNKVSYLLDTKNSKQLKELKTGFLQQIAQMKTKDPKNQSFFDFFQNLLQSSLIEDKQTPQMKSIKTLSNKNVCLIEVILLMAEISVQYYLKNKNYDRFCDALERSEKIIIGYLFSMLNSGESTKTVKTQQNQLMKKVFLTWFHFHYNLMDNQEDISFNEKIQSTIVQVFHIISLTISLICEKVGNLEKLSDCLHYGGIMQNMDGYNLYILQLLDQHILTAKKKPLLTLAALKQYINMNTQQRINVVMSEIYKDVFKRSGYMLKLLQYEVIRQILEIKNWYKSKLEQEIITCSLGMAKENYNQQLLKQRQELVLQYEDLFKKSQMEFMKNTNMIYRTSMYSWGRIWKRLRKYHYPWSNWTNQRDDKQCWKWQNKNKKIQYFKNKCSKYCSIDGSRPILEVTLLQPWHVRKRTIERQIQYMAKDYHYNFYKKQNNNKNDKPKNFLLKLFNRNSLSEEDQFNVEWIYNNEKKKGSLKILSQKLQFVFSSIYQKDSHVDFTHFRLGEFKPLTKTWDLVLITNASRRRYLAQNQCLRLEMQNNISLIFNFTDRNLDDFLMLFSKKQKSKPENKVFLKLNNIRFYTEKFDYELSQYELVKSKTEDWNERKIGNFQYLMALNRFGGRSFYDPTQYLVMPWIVSNYSSDQIIMRPLDKTMGGLGTENRKIALLQKAKISDPFNPVPNYQYGTHYSSPGVVFNFMIRMSPYTEAGKTLQGGKFDIADRIFFSINWAYESATKQMSDVRQLIPQFYYLPQFLLNLEFYDFGVTQSHQRVHNIELPSWSNNDPYQFITKHRQLMQSEQVSSHIGQWIDLIFGFKQKGKQAEQALNLYYYLTYQNSIDIETIQDPINRASVQAQIVHFGQTPHQIFEKAHIKRQPFIKKRVINLGSDYKTYDLKRNVKQSWQHISQYSKGDEPVLNISWNKANNNITLIKCNNILEYSFFEQEFQFISENFLNLKKTKNEIHLMDLNLENKIAVFGNKYIATGCSLNGQVRVYSTLGKLLQTQTNDVKNCIYVNKKQNLLMTGGKEGLFQVYEIIYQDLGDLSLVLISSEQYYYPITHISQGFGYYSICSGNIISICNINRSAVFVDKKVKKVGYKFFRSFTAKRKVSYSQIISTPLFSIVFYDGTQLWSYSINGQLISNRPISLSINPLLYIDENQMNYLLCIDDNQLIMLSTPALNTVKVLDLPKKQFTCWNFYKKYILIGTSSGQLVVVNKSFLD